MFGKVAAFAAAGMLAASPVIAADATFAKVGGVQGSVVVSQGGKLSPLSGSAGLKAGDRVLAKDGQATIEYADGCKITLKTNAMATIGEKSPCVGGQGLVSATGGDNAQLFNLTWFGTALVAIGVIGLLFLVFDDDDDPVSP